MTKGIKTFLYNSVVSSAKAYDLDYETVISELEQRRDSIKQRIATLNHSSLKVEWSLLTKSLGCMTIISCM